MNKKHINKNPIPCEVESKSPIVREVESKSPNPQHEGRLVVGIIPQGYKQTSIGTIPQDWEVVRLGEVANFFSGGTPLTTNRDYYNGTIPFIKSAEIYFDTTQEFLTYEGLQNSSAKWISKGDLLFALYGANSGEVAISKIDGVINQAVLCIKNNRKISDTTFLYNYFLMIKRYLVSKFLQGGQGNLSAQIIKSLQIPLPPLKEQEKIARILGVWDSELTSLANLIKAKRKYKTALMQRLLTPPCESDSTKSPLPYEAESNLSPLPQHEGRLGVGIKTDKPNKDFTPPLAPPAGGGEQENSLRVNDRESQSSLRFAGFSDKWQEFRLGDLLKEKNIRNANNINLVLSVTNKQGFVAQKDYFEQEVASNDTSNYKVVCRGEFAYNPARINVGSIAMLETFENGILSPMYIVFECLEKINKDFFRYWLESHNFRGILGRYLSGSVRETLSFNDMKTMKIFIPTLAEQKKIAQVLSVCDKEIETLNLKFECLKAQKRGLMQQLLSGKVRVKC